MTFDDDGRSGGSDPATTVVPATFAVDLSTGGEDATQNAAAVSAPTLPLPPISLAMPGATPPVTTMGATTLAPGVALPAGQPPENLGDDVRLDAFAGRCYAGDMAACDDLYLAADISTAYSTYGDTCAGRQPELTGELCVTTFAHATPTTIG